MIRLLITAVVVLALAGVGTSSAHADTCFDSWPRRDTACPGYERDAGPLSPIIDAQPSAEGSGGVTATPGSRRTSERLRPQPSVPREPGSIFQVRTCHDWHRCRVG